ncbi:hypothetical protein CAPTEDRAFT_143359 [Capitella teleta]|uniref:Uncharacterized protein n=1 Tax=Capitella teleta TaxID=283909 RepID=R7VED3_CAPTE|nr:hypothetical protein CAPTEDRAFT_143359 [Capitella teleta]|eukprot:ELU16942.1 hypothetical protein CAPTEDRAFT_143359 [Capitella teleta]
MSRCVIISIIHYLDACTSEQFKCANGRCITNAYRCNGNNDCRDGSDEVTYACTSEQFKCANGRCITNAYRCNGNNDCRDGSDEVTCELFFFD